MKFSTHPLWLLGFRPFFILAILAGLTLPVVWSLIYSDVLAAPSTTFSMLQWHAHEMFFGFGWAVLGGFLLTATRSWVKVRGYHGAALMFLVAAWLLERAGMWFEGLLPHWLFIVSNQLFLGAIVAMIAWTLARNRKTDFYRDNFLFLLVLPMFLISKNLLLSADYFQDGLVMAVGLFRVAFLVMLERTVTQFMRGSFQVEILNNAKLNMAIKLSGLTLVFASFLPQPVAVALTLLAALLLICRFLFWKPYLAMQRLDIGIMYLGYLAIIAQLVIEVLRLTLYTEFSISISIHVFTFGAMGLIIPAMLMRVTRGHTGRVVVFDFRDKLVLWLMILAFAYRLIAPQIDAADYKVWISLAAACWFFSYSLLAWRYIPYLLQSRIDGKEH